MKDSLRCLMMIVLLLVPALLNGATPPDAERHWTFAERFQGSSNAAGLVLKTTSTLGYTFNEHVQTYAGVPIYSVRPAGSLFSNGLGNTFAGVLLTVDGKALNYSSDLVVTAPTGDQSRGFSTGHPTVDWTNSFSKSFARFTPYASVGVANTISDTAFFVRPFSSKGAVTHFEGGTLIPIVPRVTIGGSGYGVEASGEQQFVSKVVAKSQTSSEPAAALPLNGRGNQGVFENQHEVVTSADSARDHGFSSWITFRPAANTDLQIGYSRSTSYQLDSMFFGIGFHIGH